jgi:NAD(P)H-dependent FMN reductase
MSSVREGRFCEQPAQWILEMASARPDMQFEIIDLRDYPLPLLGQPDKPTLDGASSADVAWRWQNKIQELDGYLFLTAEYNHSITGALKNALDYASSEFSKKPAAFIGYGGVGGARAVEQLRLICVELQTAPIRMAVHIGMEPYRAVVQEGKSLSDFDYLNDSASTMLDELSWWTHTLKTGRDTLQRATDVTSAVTSTGDES